MMADQKTVLRLLKTARGQIDGIIKMVEEPSNNLYQPLAFTFIRANSHI